MTESAGVLVFRSGRSGVEVLLAHPGGPYWRNKEAGAWTIPKGLVETGEDPLQAAAREFAEETGSDVDLEHAIELGSVRMRSGKLVHAWAVRGSMEPSDLVSNTFEIEWPPRSGRVAAFPEIDRVAWVDPREARRLLNDALIPFVDTLIDHLRGNP